MSEGERKERLTRAALDLAFKSGQVVGIVAMHVDHGHELDDDALYTLIIETGGALAELITETSPRATGKGRELGRFTGGS